MDHVVSTVPGAMGGNAPWADKMIESFRVQSREAGVKIYDIGQDGQGIVHVVGPELGFTLPGTTLLCGDSHTCTHGALGALAWGIGTSELTHVLATQTIVQQKPKTMRVDFRGKPPRGVTAKDLILALIGRIGTAGGVGCAVEYAGEAIRDLDMEGRMTVCNLSIELGAKIGMIAPDQKTFDYLKGRRHAPKGALWEQALAHWKTLPSDAGAKIRQGACPGLFRARAADHLGHQPGGRDRRGRHHSRQQARGPRLHGLERRQADCRHEN